MKLYLSKHYFGYFAGVRVKDNLYCTVVEHWWQLPRAWFSSYLRSRGWK